MWPFCRAKPVHNCPSTAQLQQIAADNAELRIEWAEVLDKLQAWANRQTARDTKRVKRTLGEAADGPPDDPAPQGEQIPRPVGEQRFQNRPDAKFELRRRAALLRNGD